MAVLALAFSAWVCSLLRAAWAQQAGTLKAEVHPPMPIAQCSKASGCTMEKGEVTLDSQWRWAHDGNSANCFTDGVWSASLCSDPVTCAQQCQLEGLDADDYSKIYGVNAVPGGLKLVFAPPGGSVGSRLYLMSDDSNFKMFKLKNKEFTFDVDVSSLPCGLNGAVYFVEMDQKGDWNGASNAAGAMYGTGYCDAQCPQDLKFIGGEANVLHWNTTSAHGGYGACCAELDLWEANRESTAFTVHPCEGKGGLEKCAAYADECGLCDKAGCDYNSYRMGDHSFFGPGTTFDIDTTLPMTVVTQFLTDDGTDDGELVEIRRLYVQGDKIIHNSRAMALGKHSGHSITEDYCDAQKKAFDDPTWFQQKGGLKQMGEAMGRGMVLVLSIWDDDLTGMTWLDASAPTDESRDKPGVQRGPCSTHSGHDKELRVNHPGAAVTYSNLAYGEIDSTYGKDSAKSQQKQPEMSGDFCCLASANPDNFCGNCFSSAQAPANTFCGQSEELCLSCGSHARWCPSSLGQAVPSRPQVPQQAVIPETGEVAVTLEGLNVPPGLQKGDTVMLSLGGKELQVQVIGVPVMPTTTTQTPGAAGSLWDFLPALQRNEQRDDLRVPNVPNRVSTLPMVGLAVTAVAAAALLAVSAVRAHRRAAHDERGTPLSLHDDEAVAVSPLKQMQFESPRRRRPDAAHTPDAAATHALA